MNLYGSSHGLGLMFKILSASTSRTLLGRLLFARQDTWEGGCRGRIDGKGECLGWSRKEGVDDYMRFSVYLLADLCDVEWLDGSARRMGSRVEYVQGVCATSVSSLHSKRIPEDRSTWASGISAIPKR